MQSYVSRSLSSLTLKHWNKCTVLFYCSSKIKQKHLFYYIILYFIAGLDSGLMCNKCCNSFYCSILLYFIEYKTTRYWRLLFMHVRIRLSYRSISWKSESQLQWQNAVWTNWSGWWCWEEQMLWTRSTLIMVDWNSCVIGCTQTPSTVSLLVWIIAYMISRFRLTKNSWLKIVTTSGHGRWRKMLLLWRCD